VFLSLALNGAWEFLQSPLYTDHTRGAIYVVKTRLHCAAGDALLSLFAFLVTALLFSSRQWPWKGHVLPRALFILLGLGVHRLERVVPHTGRALLGLRRLDAATVRARRRADSSVDRHTGGDPLVP